MEKSGIPHQYWGNPMKNTPSTMAKEHLFFGWIHTGLGVLIGYAGLVAAADPDQFSKFLTQHYPFLSRATSFVVDILPWVVLGLGLLIITRSNWGQSLKFFCGLVLAFASLDKLGNPHQFAEMVANFKVLPDSLVPLAGVVIPWLEFFAGLCLIFGIKWRGAALIFCGLMMVYILAMSWDLLSGIDVNCVCFKSDSTEKITWMTVLRDVLFLWAGFIVLMAQETASLLSFLIPPKPSK